jgi:hypothetical protein
MVQAAVTTYALALRQLGVERKRPIKIKLSNNVADYETHANGNVIQYRDQPARWPNGMAYLDAETLMIKAVPPYEKSELQRGVWHQMTHALQYDLSNGSSERGRPWLNEGMAGLFAFLAAGQVDADSIVQWKATLHRKLVELDSHLTPADLLDIDAYNWDELTDTSHGANYAVADLMMLRVYETNGGKTLPGLVSYYGCLTAGLTPESSCFKDALGAVPARW